MVGFPHYVTSFENYMLINWVAGPMELYASLEEAKQRAEIMMWLAPPAVRHVEKVKILCKTLNFI